MTEIMAQPSLALAPPASRQDVISALLTDYGTSFAHEPSTNKELPPPPPPPRADSLRNGCLPAAQRMAMKFQLRGKLTNNLDEEPPLSPNGSHKDSSEQLPKRRIVSRSLSRESKPASLKLVISNGSTASIPLTPAVSTPAQTLASSAPFGDKDLPPAPPEKSAKRQPTQAAMGNRQSANTKDLTRNDSLLSQNDQKPSVDVPSYVTPVVTRKPVPVAAMKTIKNLAEVSKGSTGSRDLSSITSAPRKASVDNQISISGLPQKDQFNTAAMPPQKASVDADIPSSARSKALLSPLHLRGKSSAGFNILKMNKSPRTVPTVMVNTITPEMTPSPTLRPDLALNDMQISPTSPLPPPLEQNRPFSFEASNESRKGPLEQSTKPTTPAAASSTPNLATKVKSPPQDKNLGTPASNSNTRTFATPAQQLGSQLLHSPPMSPVRENPPSSPPFVPLTRQHIARPNSAIPPISSSQLHCYTSHRINIWSNNAFQPMGCQICHDNARDRKWACVWCQLRICLACSEELRMVPGRNLTALLQSKEDVTMTATTAATTKAKSPVKVKSPPAVRSPTKPVPTNPGVIVSSADNEVTDSYEDRFRA